MVASGGVKRRWICLALLLGLLQPVHIRIMPGKRSKGNPDPSRAPAPGADGIAAAGHDDRAVLPDSVGAGDWRSAADGGEPAGGRRGCNSAVRGRSGNREKRSRGIRCPSKTVAGEVPPQESPCVSTGGTGQGRLLRGRLEPARMWWPDEGCHTGTPSLPTTGSLPVSCLRRHITTSLGLLMIGRMIAPLARMMLLAFGSYSENYVFR